MEAGAYDIDVAAGVHALDVRSWHSRHKTFEAGVHVVDVAAGVHVIHVAAGAHVAMATRIET